MPGPLPFALVNTSNTNDPIWAYVTGLSLSDNKRCLLKADGKSVYYPSDPPKIGSPLQADCAIKLGGPGSTTTITVPQLAGGRVWFSRIRQLTLLLNPGPALVEPSVLNPSDPNAKTDFSFAEFTLNDAQIYANISFVDFVPRLPVGLSLECQSGQTQVVQGLPSNGLDVVATKLADQTSKDNQPWSSLIVSDSDQPLRALNPTHADAVSASFETYFDPYVDMVWDALASTSLSINTQSASGTLDGQVDSASTLNLGSERFQKPSTGDIFGCDSGPFETSGASRERLALIPRLAAGFNRSCVLDGLQPSGLDTYYENQITNHYSRIVHEVVGDGKGYGFAYDDVQPDGGRDQSGKVDAGDPVRLVIRVGGGSIQDVPAGEQGVSPGGQRHGLKGMAGGLMQKVLHR